MIKKRVVFLLILYVLLTILTAEWIIYKGNTYVLTPNLPKPVTNIDDVEVIIEQDGNYIEILDKKIVDGKVQITLKGITEGKAFVNIQQGDYSDINRFIVHKNGIITANSYLGNTNGSIVIVYSSMAFLFCWLIVLIITYRQSVKENLYKYKNIAYVALIIFLVFLFLDQFYLLNDYHGLINSIDELLSLSSFFSMYLFPIAFITSIFVVISNIVLIKKEGFTIRNLVGALMGAFFCVASIAPEIIYQMSYSSALIEIHNESSIAYHIYFLFNSLFCSLITYLECVLIATIYLSIKAAKRIPKCDKDYIITLGCQIKKDGTLTNLLKSRVDRAIYFSNLQKEKTGKGIRFVVSGGKGNDEIISEAQAMKNYLLEKGIEESDIILEDKSTNTFENFKYSNELIKKENEKANIAFSTNNYHVFRSGVTATSNGMITEGIGGKTKSYFWINAFFREFIATLYYERKRHRLILLWITITSIIMVWIIYLSNVVFI
ncbi:MAG: YdcF family protein [Clostridia bacterium]|nr:YdcF family protein [Clostridia bacterium]